MKTKRFSRIAAVIMAAVMGLVMAIPAFASVPNDDVKVPLLSLARVEENTTSMSPDFQQNTTVYTVVVPTEKFAALAVDNIVDTYITYDAGTIPAEDVSIAYNDGDSAYKSAKITLTKGDDHSSYWVIFTDKSQQVTEADHAYINVIKVLSTEDIDKDTAGKQEPKVDNLKFKYDLFSNGTVENTTPASYDTSKTNPLSAAVANDGENDGVVSVDAAATTDTKSVMTMDSWDDSAVKTIDNTHPLYGKKDAHDNLLDGNKYMTGKFDIKYTAVGQYKYLLHEQQPSAADKITGVNYDNNWYQVTVSVVHSDPNDPTSPVVVGWIEIKIANVTVGEGGTITLNSVGAKVNFGQTSDYTGDGDDSMKYDNNTTAVTYPFVNILATDNLTVSKYVTGDLGDAAQEFLFKVSISGMNMAEKYHISYTSQAGDTTSKPENIYFTTNTTEGEDKGKSTAETYITLKHNEEFKIEGLPVGCLYTVEELTAGKVKIVTDGNSVIDNTTAGTDIKSEEAANYNTTITYDNSTINDAGTADTKTDDFDNQSVLINKSTGDGEDIKKLFDSTDNSNDVDFNNDKPLTPPTGAFVDMIPYIAIVVVAVGGFVGYTVIRKRKNAFED